MSTNKKNDLNICILKSGDFREDSGLYFSIGNFTSLLNVDSNSINFNRLQIALSMHPLLEGEHLDIH